MMTAPIKVLDHGSVKLLNIAGPIRRPNAYFDADSIDPAMTARISFDQMGSVRTREDELKLVKYLIDNKHNTPLEMIEVYFEMELPIFIARQFVRHRTVTINEVSGRYVELPEKFYIPEIVGGKPTGGAKQGQADTLDKDTQEWFRIALTNHCQDAFTLYRDALSYGIAPEHARMALPLNTYTRWVWKQDLHNLTHFLRLRQHSHAQVEARKYADAVHELLSRALPDLMSIYDDINGRAE